MCYNLSESSDVMNKWLKNILRVIGIIILTIVIDLVCIFAINRPIFSQSEDYGTYAVYKGLFFNTYICPEFSTPQIKVKGAKYTCAVLEIDKEKDNNTNITLNEEKDNNTNIALNEVNDFIIDYFSKEESDNSNLSFHYVDEETNVVIVGLIDNSDKKQEEFIYNVFSNCCGSTYIKYIKENKIIKFEKADPNQNYDD